MSFLDLLKKKKEGLKEATIEKDSSQPKYFQETTKEDIINYQKQILSVNIEEWEECLSKPFQEQQKNSENNLNLSKLVTFPTWYLPITKKEAKSFVLYIVNKNNISHDDLDNYDQLLVENPDYLSVLENLQERLQSLIDKIFVDTNAPGVFVKTSSRSPKDAPALSGQLRTIYKDFVTSHFSPPYTTNDKITGLLWAGVQMLKVKSAKEAMDLLCSSIRIMQDFNLALNALAADDAPWHENIVVRSWTDIEVDMEFRAFVKGRKMNALSQYNEIAFFPRLAERKEIIQDLILDFFNNSILPLLPETFQDFIIDFAITGDLSSPKLWVIELNPFLETTNAILFSWKEEKELLENGPFEFRIRDKIPSGDKANLAVAWRSVIEEVIL